MLVLGKSYRMTGRNNHSDPVQFESIQQSEVPIGRDGKHKLIVTRLLKGIDNLKPGMALKVPLEDLPDTKENIRSALSRAATQHQVDIATSSNDEFLYIWKKNGHQAP
jgi:TusA-related sulfurtransferase